MGSQNQCLHKNLANAKTPAGFPEQAKDCVVVRRGEEESNGEKEDQEDRGELLSKPI